MWGFWRYLSSLALIHGENCRIARVWSLPPRPVGAWPPARTRLSPSASSICAGKQRLTGIITGVPKAASKDVLRWAAQGEKPVSRTRNLSTWRANGARMGPAIAETAARMNSEGSRELEAAVVIESKFGPVTLLRLAVDANDVASCLGFIKHLDEPNVRISGWSRQGDDMPARRAAVGCMLNGLILLTSGNEPKLAELFTRAELRRGNCTAAVLPSTSADWVTGAQNPKLHGSL